MDISPFIPNCAGKELRQALLPFIANAMSYLPSEQDKPEVIDLLKMAGIVFALKDNNVALNLKAIEDVSDVVSYLKFLLLLLLNKLSFSDTTVIEGGRERKHR